MSKRSFTKGRFGNIHPFDRAKPHLSRWEGVKKLSNGKSEEPKHVQGTEKFACQNEAVISYLPAGPFTFALGISESYCIFLRSLLFACVPLRKSGEPSRGNECPADFGGANFPLPWTTRKAFSSPISIFSQLRGGQGGGDVLHVFFATFRLR